MSSLVPVFRFHCTIPVSYTHLDVYKRQASKGMETYSATSAAFTSGSTAGLEVTVVTAGKKVGCGSSGYCELVETDLYVTISAKL